MVELSRVVPRRTRDQIEETAWQARAWMQLKPYERVPVAYLIENVLPNLLPGFEYRVAEGRSLGAAEAITDSNRPVITFSERTYSGLYRDKHRPRMTAIHELRHLLLHTNQHGYAFQTKYDPQLDAERQANIFAAAFLMPECAFKQVKSIDEAMTRFGVSRDAASCRARNLGMGWMIEGKPAPRHPKKKGSSSRRTP